ncbi:hypothetical protein PCAR4_10019 [Paraburkholderia caribensis]|nr:hypothetical protein PCAR4_10019 [Paraburkholderia caribensis]
MQEKQVLHSCNSYPIEVERRSPERSLIRLFNVPILFLFLRRTAYLSARRLNDSCVRERTRPQCINVLLLNTAC